MTQRGSWSLVLLDRVSDSFALAVFFIQFCFVLSTCLCLNFLVRGHLIAASADVPFTKWLCFNAFVPSIGHFNICFTSGNQYTQLDSSFAKHSSISVKLRLSCLCASSFVRLHIKSTQNRNDCRMSRYSITLSINLLLAPKTTFS